ncbi:hypothetical protein [Jannaschia sp. LMIT008]|uniref:hypothetical protein n=1 Tax=Jannaschia maritima TaxID=3032585 RepID=UPI002810D09D|nr:hypothetical protein [Jannaschia sp. LMIT008]
MDPTAPIPPNPASPSQPRARPDRADPLWQQAVKLESLLFEQMLEASGMGSLSPAGGGSQDGPSKQFDSFLRKHQAEALAGRGDGSLAAQLYRELKDAAGDR